MKKALPSTIGKWNQLISKHARDSDRAIAVWAGSFVENHLQIFLATKTVGGKISEKLFDVQGPLGTFSACNTVAMAFGFIDRSLYSELDAIRHIRNHFAHFPFEAEFGDKEIEKHLAKLPSYDPFELKGDRRTGPGARKTYLESCGMTCALLDSLSAGRLSED